MKLRLQLLGGFRALLDEKPLEGFISSKAPALLSYLAVTGRPVSRDELAGLLWSDQPDDIAKTSLRQVLSNLNKLLGEHIRIERNLVEFSPLSPIQVDVLALEKIARQNDLPDLDGQIQAVESYRGDFLQGFQVREAPEFEEWAVTQRERYRLMVLQLLGDLAGHGAQQGDYPQAIHYARRILQLEPWREETHRQLMLWLTRSGQRSAAIKQFHDCQAVLAKELRVTPSAETAALYQRLQAAIASPRSHIPPQTIPLIGRDQDLSAVLARLRDPACRLLTLTGLGGIGKTRLALEVAMHLEPSCINGACFVPLANLESPDLLIPTIASAAGCTLSPNSSLEDQLLGFLKAREMLLVMDNLEQLLVNPPERSETLRLLSRILNDAPDVKLLVTSRVRLNLRSETAFALDGVETHQALRLFVESARRVESRFELMSEATPHAQRICHLVQGNPLGIELASAQIRVLSLKNIADEIQHSLDFLSADLGDAPERQLSMRAVFKHSWRLLSGAERELFQKLAVFRGGFTLEAARQVAGATPQILAALVDKSLLKHNPAGRFELHELMRQFGEEKLNQSQQGEAVRRQHQQFFAEYLDALERESRTGNMRQCLEKIAADYDNMRLAWQRAMDGLDAEILFKMVTGLQVFFLRSGRVREGYAQFGQWVAQLRQSLGTSQDLRLLELLAKILTQEASLQTVMGEFGPAREKAREAVGLYRTLGIPRQLSRSLTYVGNNSYYLGDTRGASQAWEESLEISRQEGDETQIAVMLGNLGHASMANGDFVGADTRFQEALKLHRKSGETARIAIVLSSLGELANSRGQSQQALQWLEEALEINRKNADRPKTGLVLTNLSVAYDRTGKSNEHQGVVNEALDIAREVNALDLLAAALSNKAHLCAKLGQAPEANHFATEAVEVARQINSPTMTAMVAVALSSTVCELGLYYPAAVLSTVVLGNAGRRSSDNISAQQTLQNALKHLSPEQHEQAEAKAQQSSLENAVQLALNALAQA